MEQLITKTSSAVAVTDELTTLIDWTSIEMFSGFSILVANAGGGDGEDISDIRIDTSNDGGITASLDQHPGVPAVPVVSGGLATGTFTETAKYIRVRAVCGSGYNTTASAWLLADSSLARICTLADVKDRLGLGSNTEYDTLINRIITGLEPVFNSETLRQLIAPSADVTEYYTGLSPYLQLDRFPVITITSIKESSDYDFDNVDALVVNTDYRILKGGDNGIIFRPFSHWSDSPDGIQVIYRGGYCPAGSTPGTNETALPADIREAAIMQATFIYKRKDDIGLSGVSAEGGSMSKFSDMELLPYVKNILKQYRKPSL